jgi:hypothetical protein
MMALDVGKVCFLVILAIYSPLQVRSSDLDQPLPLEDAYEDDLNVSRSADSIYLKKNHFCYL